jgi:hypothetical protein
MTTPAPSPLTWFVARPPDRTYMASKAERWESSGTAWQDLPGASVSLLVGSDQSPSSGAIFVATFSAETLVKHPADNGCVFVDIEFGGQASVPGPDNHRFKSAAKSAEWSSHTTIRHIRFEPQAQQRNATAQVRVNGTQDGQTGYGFQNWVLKIERYNI